MNNDITAPQPEEEQGGDTSAKPTKKKSLLSPMIAFLGVGGTILVAFVVGFAIAWSFIKWREPAPITYAGGYNGGSLGCTLKNDAFNDTETIKYGKATIEESADEVIKRINDKDLNSQKDKVVQILKAGINSGVNPAVLIAIWGGEQGFNGSDAALKKAFGCGVYDSDKDKEIENMFPRFTSDSSGTGQLECSIKYINKAMDSAPPYNKPTGQNIFTRLFYNYTGTMKATYAAKKYVADESNSRIKILQKLVPDQVVCTSASFSSSTGFAFPDWGFKQEDSRWINYAYNKPSSCFEEKTIGSSGCGPTSLAMVLKKYGINTTPPKVADDIKAINGRVCDGTSYGAIISVAKKYGLEAQSSSWSDAKKALKNGGVVITSMQSSSYADDPSRKSGGHIVVLAGIDDQDNILVNDPYRNYTKITEQIITQASKGIFIIIGPSKTS